MAPQKGAAANRVIKKEGAFPNRVIKKEKTEEKKPVKERQPKVTLNRDVKRRGELVVPPIPVASSTPKSGQLEVIKLKPIIHSDAFFAALIYSSCQEVEDYACSEQITVQ